MIQKTAQKLFNKTDNHNSQPHTESASDDSSTFQIVGRRHAGANYEKYLTEVHGREIIDYDKLRDTDPALYESILRNEREDDRLSDIYTDYITDEDSILKYALCSQCGRTGTLI